MARTFLAALLLSSATAAGAQGFTYSESVAALGLRGAEAALAALRDPSPSDRFMLGSVRFLGGIERALQLRYRVGLSDGLAVASGLPVLRLPIPENPSPDAFEAAMIGDLFEAVAADMAEAAATLEAIGDDDAVAVTIDLADLWFDIDADGARSPGEGVAEVAALLLEPAPGFEEYDKYGNVIEPAPPGPPPVVRFDTADAAWLQAYAHLLGAFGEGVLALGPDEAIGRVLDARAAMDAFPQPVGDEYGFSLAATAGDGVDLAAMALLALDGVPDAARTRAMRDGLLLAIEDSRRFWRLVARETDDEAEWIPNKRQSSALPLPFPADTGPRWLAVLAEAEAVLRGEALLPWWRVGEGAGVDLAALLESPPDLNAVGLVQGEAIVPYLREGPVADGRSLAAFAEMVGGRAVLYAAVLN